MNITDIVQKYVDLLIIQYNNKPKARALIELFCNEILANGIVWDVQNGYNLETAVGLQLDVIGKYAGIDRFYKYQDLQNYFALTDYSESPIDSLKYGFSNYTNYGTETANGTLAYNDVIQTNFRLSDDNYRILIKLRIIQNHSNHSHYSIDNSIFQFFGTTVIASSNGNMIMVYFVPQSQSELIKAAISKNVMPRPMGVGLYYITYTQEFLALSTYSNDQSSDLNVTGFTNYSLISSKTGETLNYSKIQTGA